MNKPKAPGCGYRWLMAHEKLRPTDQFLFNGGWKATHGPGQLCGDNYVYRRLRPKTEPRKTPTPPRPYGCQRSSGVSTESVLP